MGNYKNRLRPGRSTVKFIQSRINTPKITQVQSETTYNVHWFQKGVWLVELVKIVRRTKIEESANKIKNATGYNL